MNWKKELYLTLIVIFWPKLRPRFKLNKTMTTMVAIPAVTVIAVLIAMAVIVVAMTTEVILVATAVKTLSIS
jgi:hypothetical protein